VSVRRDSTGCGHEDLERNGQAQGIPHFKADSWESRTETLAIVPRVDLTDFDDTQIIDHVISILHSEHLQSPAQQQRNRLTLIDNS
jgi:hypothetical protein